MEKSTTKFKNLIFHCEEISLLVSNRVPFNHTQDSNPLSLILVRFKFAQKSFLFLLLLGKMKITAKRRAWIDMLINEHVLMLCACHTMNKFSLFSKKSQKISAKIFFNMTTKNSGKALRRKEDKILEGTTSTLKHNKEKTM